MRSLAAVVLLLAACAGPTSPTPIEHVEIIAEEWAIAQEALSPAISQARNVKYSSFTWIVHDGKCYECGYTEGVNGCFSPGDRAIHWNIHTPGVIQHEAAHAILKVLGIPCWRYVSLDSGEITFHTRLDENKDCERWFAAHFGGDHG